MYGMIHRAMRQMVNEKLGEEAWRALEKKLDIGPTELLTAMVYDDDLTFKIVAEAADRLNLPMDKCLFVFGNYWIRYADQGPLGSIMNFTGATLPIFIANLDRLHLAVGTAMPGTRLPSFHSLESAAEYILVEYRSERTGMEEFVRGLFHGLMEKFDVTGRVEIVERSADAILFEIRYAEEK